MTSEPTLDHVVCSRCGARVSNDVIGELTVRAWVECPECIKRTMRTEDE